MSVEIRGIGRDRALRDRVTRRTQEALDQLRVRPVTGQVTFFDDNGPKGGLGIRCAIMARVPYRPTVRVEARAESPRLAFDSAFKTLERRLERYREMDRDRRRHPKKYFAAQLLAEGEKPGRSRALRKG